jgi:hypothetical protein
VNEVAVGVPAAEPVLEEEFEPVQPDSSEHGPTSCCLSSRPSCILPS